MSGLIELSAANLSQRNLTRNYLTAIVYNCRTNKHFQIVSNTHHTCAVYNITNQPRETDIAQLTERLETATAFGLIAWVQGNIPIITGRGLMITPMIDITHINPSLLANALKQEITKEAKDAKTLDLRTWTYLPKMIKDHWRRFNPELRTHIMNCMTEFLCKQPGLHLNNDYSSTLFSTVRRFPSIPVQIASTNFQTTKSNESRDLMEVLASASLERINVSQLMPGTKAMEELKFRINTLTSTLSRRI